MENKKRVISIKKITIFLIILLLIVLVIMGIIKIFRNKDNDKKIDEINVIDKIENYDYFLAENKTEYYKTIFNELKVELSKDFIDEEIYAQLVTKLFISDLLDLDSKVSSSDIGGTQFIYSNYRNDFVSIAKTTIYKYVESNIYNNRNQKLPIVNNVDIKKIEVDKFSYNDTDDKKAYNINVLVTFKEDLGYEDEYSVVVIHNENKLEIAKLEPTLNKQ